MKLTRINWSRRQLRVLLGFVVGGCFLAGTATVAFGWHIWVAYARFLQSLDIQKLRNLSLYVDLSAFFTLLAGQRFASGLTLLFTAAVLPFVIGAWRRYPFKAPLAWASTISWTLILSPYVPLHDTILIVPSLIVSADSLRLGCYNALPGIMLLIFICSWLTKVLASSLHLLLLTLAIGLLGTLQLAACLQKTPEASAR